MCVCVCMYIYIYRLFVVYRLSSSEMDMTIKARNLTEAVNISL